VKVFSKAKLHWHNQELTMLDSLFWNELADSWASKCDGWPSDGITVIGRNGTEYLSDPNWCTEAIEGLMLYGDRWRYVRNPAWCEDVPDSDKLTRKGGSKT
jgi:hypothetical protein